MVKFHYMCTEKVEGLSVVDEAANNLLGLCGCIQNGNIFKFY